MRCVVGTVAAAAVAIFIWNRRTLSAACAKRRLSYSWPPNTFTTRWQPIDSSSTWFRSPIADCSARLIFRSRSEKYRVIQTMGGPTTNTSSVSCQLSQSIQASSPTTASESFTITFTALVAAPVTCVTL